MDSGTDVDHKPRFYVLWPAGESFSVVCEVGSYEELRKRPLHGSEIFVQDHEGLYNRREILCEKKIIRFPNGKIQWADPECPWAVQEMPPGVRRAFVEFERPNNVRRRSYDFDS